MTMSSEERWLHRFCLATACATLFLILAGGLVTSTGSGLAVPDWPLSYGMVFPPMVGGVFYEHGHRMVATAVGFLTVVMAGWLWRVESRRWVRNLGVAAVLAVVLQGLLGGLTVLFLLPKPVSIAHACLAQTFFCITICLALFTSPSWRVSAQSIPDGARLRRMALASTVAVFIQLILGALVRHTESALAIPDFPLSFGHILPPMSDLTVDPHAPFPSTLGEFKTRVLIHYSHRAWAVVVFGKILWTTAMILERHPKRLDLALPATAMGVLVLTQIALGAYVVWSEKSVAITSAHVVVGATILATSLLLTLRTWRLVPTDRIEGTLAQTLGAPA